MEALSEVFTRSYFGVVVMQRLGEVGEKDEVVRRVARYLTDDLLTCALRARRAIVLPPSTLAVMGALTQSSAERDSGDLLDAVGEIADDFGA